MTVDSSPITSPVIEMLRVGRALIEMHGLARGSVEEDGKLCMIGGIVRQSRFHNRVMDQAFEYLARAIPVAVLAISAWNDVPGRTTADALAAYDRAIDLAIADLANGIIGA